MMWFLISLLLLTVAYQIGWELGMRDAERIFRN